MFPYPVQSLLVEQYKIARKEIVEGKEPQENVGDDLVLLYRLFILSPISAPMQAFVALLYHHTIIF